MSSSKFIASSLSMLTIWALFSNHNSGGHIYACKHTSFFLLGSKHFVFGVFNLQKEIIYDFVAAEINAVENELSSIWGADSPGWEVVGDENLGPKNRSYKYQVDYFAVSFNYHITLLRLLSPIACSKYKVRFPQ